MFGFLIVSFLAPAERPNFYILVVYVITVNCYKIMGDKLLLNFNTESVISNLTVKFQTGVLN